jgi:hypothetical protein
VRVDVEGGELDETEVDAFVNERWLVTVRKNDGFSIAPYSSDGTVRPTWRSTE